MTTMTNSAADQLQARLTPATKGLPGTGTPWLPTGQASLVSAKKQEEGTREVHMHFTFYRPRAPRRPGPGGPESGDGDDSKYCEPPGSAAGGGAGG
jgi:hypothetical protein